jgi:iron complex transport system substrate-binding protein
MFLVLLAVTSAAAFGAASGKPALDSSRLRVVSLVPAATEIIRALAAEEMLVGLTIHDLPAGAADDPRVVGGFAAPSVQRIKALAPDLIILADLHREVREHFKNDAEILAFSVDSLEGAFHQIEQLGSTLGREEAARQLIRQHRTDLARVADQLTMVPAAERRRMMRLMTSDPLGAPGDDSFQNDFIRAAGGIPPVFGKSGHIVALTPQEIQTFDPQVIYVCGEDAMERVLNNEALQTIDAVRNGRVLTFPCDFTCRAGTGIGSFVSQLATSAYEEYFQ